VRKAPDSWAAATAEGLAEAGRAAEAQATAPKAVASMAVDWVAVTVAAG
tara:strand:+ start:377 stop:523 length:147 start_codon:yes stop_codon:yes gene_type:complete